MLLPFRWLLFGTAAQSTGKPSSKLRRKLNRLAGSARRLAQWSEAIAPPRVSVVAAVSAAVLNPPRVAPARVSISAPVGQAFLLAEIRQPAISIAASVAPISANIEIATVSIEAGIDLFDYEIAALMAA